jgi:hypothetical protein
VSGSRAVGAASPLDMEGELLAGSGSLPKRFQRAPEFGL